MVVCVNGVFFWDGKSMGFDTHQLWEFGKALSVLLWWILPTDWTAADGGDAEWYVRCVWNYNFRKERWLSLLSGEGGAGFVVAFVDIGFMGAFTKLYGISAIHLDPIWVIGFSEMESALDKLIFRFRLELDASFQTNQNRNKTNNSDIHPFSEKLLDHFFFSWSCTESYRSDHT